MLLQHRGASPEVCLPFSTSRLGRSTCPRACLPGFVPTPGSLTLLPVSSLPCPRALFHALGAHGVVPYRASSSGRGRSASRRPPPSCRYLAAPVDRAAVTGPIAVACALMTSAYPESRRAAKDPRGPTTGPVTSPESVGDQRRVNRAGRSLLSWGYFLSRALHRTMPGSWRSKASGLSPLGGLLLLPWTCSRRSCHLPRERRSHLRAGPPESCSARRGHDGSRRVSALMRFSNLVSPLEGSKPQPVLAHRFASEPVTRRRATASSSSDLHCQLLPEPLER